MPKNHHNDLQERKLNIGVTVGSSSRLAGGLFNSVRHTAIALTEQGHHVKVWSGIDKYVDEDRADWDPIVPQLLQSKLPRRLGHMHGLSKVLDSSNVDVVHQHGVWEVAAHDVASWGKKTGRPVVISPRGMLDPWALKNAGWKKRIAAQLWANRALNNAACLHALNTSEAKSLRAYGLTNPIATIPNGIDLPNDGQTSRLAASPWCGERRHTLLFLGRIHPKKGVEELVLAWAQLKQRDPLLAARWKVVIAGWEDGNHTVRLQKIISDCGLNDDVLLPGALYDDAKASALKHATAFVLPSYSEGLPMSVLEAWAYKLPVLMTENCNLPEGFARGAAIRITTDPEELALTLMSALPKIVNSSLGIRGRLLIEEKFTLARIANMHAEAYNYIINGGTAPATINKYI